MIVSGDFECVKNMMMYMIDEVMVFIEKEIVDKEVV